MAAGGSGKTGQLILHLLQKLSKPGNMVIGNGLVAKSFGSYTQNDGFLVFASGVSNSKSSTEEDFSREQNLLLRALKENAEKQIVYFSTTSVDDPDLVGTAYVQHKLNMEELIRTNANRYSIFRLSNLAGHSDNPNTILNYFWQHISQGIPFQLWQYSERNIIDTEDVFSIADYMLKNGLATNRTVNIANPESYPVTQIVNTIQEIAGKKAIYTVLDRGAPVRIDTRDIAEICRALGIKFGVDYLPAILKKYYGS